MGINQRLDLKQGQTLTMTPQLQQAIKLLQMSNIELNEFVEAELEKNPLLEREESPPPAPEEGGAAAAPGEGGDTGGDEARADMRDEGRELDTSFDNVFTGGSRAEEMDEGARGMAEGMADLGGYDAFATNAFAGAGKGGGAAFDDPDFSLENTMAEEVSLRAHLTDQINLSFADNKDRAIALLMIDYLDASGYFRAEVADLAARLGCEAARVENILSALQELDPAGIFARNLSECLALQLKERDRLDPAMQALLDHLDLLAGHDLKKLKSLCGVGDDDLKEMIAEIRALNPKPALAFEHFVAQTVVPDVLMKPLPKSKGGGWAVELNADTLPRVLVNKTYYAEVSRTAREKREKEYLSEQMNAASWLVKAMDQRAQTILKVAGEIILQQEAFFNYGVEFLRPLVLRDIAAAIGMHESTVSRVTSGKYIGTPRGVFELKYFFTSGVSGGEGGAVSSEAVKARIRALVEAEAADNILSDDDLADLLTKEGIDIARRTVAKYREALKIPSSVQRRRMKNA